MTRTVLHIITDLDQGGAEMALFRVIQSDQHIANRHVVLSLVKEGVLRNQFESVCDVHDLGLEYGQLSIQALFRLKNICVLVKPDIIQGWMYHGNVVASLASFLSGKKPVIHGVRQCLYADQEIGRLTRILIQLNSWLSRRASLTLYNSETAKAHHIQRGFDPSSCRIWYNGYDTKCFQRSLEKRRNMRTSLGLSEDNFLIGKLGRFHPMKDYPTLIESFRMIHEKHKNTHLALGGKGLDIHNPELKQIIRNSGVPVENFHLLGPVQETSSFYNGLDCFVLSSNSEAFPNVVVEALLYEIPVVATDVGEVSTILDCKSNTVSPGQPDQIAKKVAEFIEYSASERQELSAKLKESIESRFSIERCVEQLNEFFQEASKS